MHEHEKWLFQRKAKDSAKIRLICFHYAAGNAAWFLPWEKYCGSDIELCAVQLPQRSERMAEEMPDSIEELVAQFLTDNPDLFEKPFVLFGHSMGAMIACEAAFQLKAKGVSPKLLVVSACGAPLSPEIQSTGRSICSADDFEIKQILNDYGQIGQELLDSPEFCEYYFPIVRSDFHVCEMYYKKPSCPLDCRILALRGIDDGEVSEEDCALWGKYTSADCVVKKFTGAHFFPQDHTPEILDMIRVEQNRG